MNRVLLLMVLLLGITGRAYADGGHAHHAVPTMPSLGQTTLTIDDQTVTPHIWPHRSPNRPRRRPGLEYAEEGVPITGRHLHDRLQV